jgi:hypothetical protein
MGLSVGITALAQAVAADIKSLLASVAGKAIAIAASNIDLSQGSVYTKTITSATTFTLSNIPATGTVAAFLLELTNGGAFTTTLFSGVKWASGAAPVLTASGVDTIGFYTTNGGTTWRGVVLGKDFR